MKAAMRFAPALPAVVVAAAVVGLAMGAQPNPPVWPSSVKQFSQKDSPEAIAATVNEVFKENGGYSPANHGQFSNKRYALFFMPGTYDVEVPVGYYTQVLGLGAKPEDVVFTSKKGVYCQEGNKANMYGALSTFWRGAENFMTKADMLWATAQASPLRRAVVSGDVKFSEYILGLGEGYSSGGFVANVQVKGSAMFSSQQQYCSRNAAFQGSIDGGVWNMVYIGSSNAPESRCGKQSKTQAAVVTVPQTPHIAEKPFVSVDASGKYFLNIPQLQRNRVGIDFSRGKTVDFSEVYTATDSDSAAVINSHLDEGLHVVLSPGIYHLEAPLELKKENQVLLGLGLATLVAAKGNTVIKVGNVDGVRVAGVLLQAGTGDTDALLEWGDGSHPGDALNPGFLHDVFARVGGPENQYETQVRAKVMVRINNGHVIGDNLWLWRADHTVQGIVRNGDNPCENGLVVNGDHVTMYGLAVEHTLGDLVVWNGDKGATYFYQSELPYDATPAYGEAGHAGYHVTGLVKSHKGYGIGVYHFFRDYDVRVKAGIHVPEWLENSFESPLGVWLSGRGTMEHIMNGRGKPSGKDDQVTYVCDKGPTVPYNPTTSTRTTTKTTTFTGTRTTSTTIATTSTTTTSKTTTTATASTTATKTKTKTTTTRTTTSTTRTITVTTTNTKTTTRTTTSTTGTTTTTRTATGTTTTTTTTTSTTSSWTGSSSTSTTTTTELAVAWWSHLLPIQPGGGVNWLPVIIISQLSLAACFCCKVWNRVVKRRELNEALEAFSPRRAAAATAFAASPTASPKGGTPLHVGRSSRASFSGAHSMLGRLASPRFGTPSGQQRGGGGGRAPNLSMSSLDASGMTPSPGGGPGRSWPGP